MSLKPLKSVNITGSKSKELNISVAVSDPDLGENGTVTLTLANYGELFEIKNTSRHMVSIYYCMQRYYAM